MTSPNVYFFPTEYLSYGAGGTANVVMKQNPQGDWYKEYRIADHLGSTRVVLTTTGTLSETDYEPFGGVLSQFSSAPRKSFIDKEKDAENGLGDFGVRKYDDDLGRFFSVDPLWEKYRGLSPYHYGHNNPLNRLDPTGLADYYNQDGWVANDGVDDGARFALNNDYKDYKNSDGSYNFNAMSENSFRMPNDHIISSIMDFAGFDCGYNIFGNSPFNKNAEMGGVIATKIYDDGKVDREYFDGGVNRQKPSDDSYAGEATKEVIKAIGIAGSNGYKDIEYYVHSHPTLNGPSTNDRETASPGIVLTKGNVYFYNGSQTATVPLHIWKGIANPK